MRGPFRYLGLLLLFSLSLLPLAAEQNLTVEEMTLIPQRVPIGEPVTMHITLEGEISESVEISLEQDPWIEVRAIEQVTKGSRLFVFIQFINYYPGTREMPEVRIGPLVLDPPILDPVSMLEEHDVPFQPLRSELLVPGTKAAIAGVSICIALIAAGVIGIVLKFKSLAQAVHRTIRGAGFRRRRQKLFKLLAVSWESIEQGEIYRRLADLLRLELQVFYGFVSAGMSGSELAAAVARLDIDTGMETEAFEAMVRRSNSVRFGRGVIEPQQVHDDIRSMDTLTALLGRPGKREKRSGRHAAV